MESLSLRYLMSKGTSKFLDFKYTANKVSIPLFAILLFLGCSKDLDPNVQRNHNQAIILVVWDGIRLSDITTEHGSLDPTKVPFLTSLANKSNSFFTYKFFHEGYTYTMAGHLALLSGRHIAIANDASGKAPYRTLLHKTIIQKNLNPEKVWIVATKKKICSLAQCTDSICNDIPKPQGMCNLYGLWGPIDNRTFQGSIQVIQNYKPNLLLVSFAAPDITAHAGNYDAYIQAIKQVDEYTSHLYSLVNTIYTDSVIFIITTDHGRHDYDYKGHGDKCSGCTSLFLLVNLPFQQTISLPPYLKKHNPIVHRDIYCWMAHFMSISDPICFY